MTDSQLIKDRFLIVIAGPTAVGKTSLSIDLAERYETEIISADSRQLYKEFKIGTSPPPEEALKRVPHHFIHSHSIFNPITAGDYEREGLALLNRLYDRHRVVFLVGGSGLYIKALCEGLNRFPDVPDRISKQIEEQYDRQGIEYLKDYLRVKDPTYYEEVDLNNPRRLLRAVKVIESSGKAFSHFRQGDTGKRVFDPLYFALNRPREILYERINKRVDQMMQNGLLEEVKELYPHRDLRTLQTVGYKELFKYLDGTWSLDTAVEKIKRNTRRYAKRQLTWFRNDEHYRFYQPEKDRDDILKSIKLHVG